MRKALITAILASTLLMSTEYTLQSGWNLLGTQYPIKVSTLLANPAVKNVVIYQDGEYKSTASNGFSTIPEHSGFFVYTESSTNVTINDSVAPTATLIKLDGNLQVVTDDTWEILQIKEANLLVEMKTNAFSAGMTYTQDEAEAYCRNLTVGIVSDWRLPTLGELQALTDIYLHNASQFKIRSENSLYWSSTQLTTTSFGYAWAFQNYLTNTVPENALVSAFAYDTKSLYALCIKEP